MKYLTRSLLAYKYIVLGNKAQIKHKPCVLATA